MHACGGSPPSEGRGMRAGSPSRARPVAPERAVQPRRPPITRPPMTRLPLSLARRGDSAASRRHVNPSAQPSALAGAHTVRTGGRPTVRTGGRPYADRPHWRASIRGPTRRHVRRLGATRPYTLSIFVPLHGDHPEITRHLCMHNGNPLLGRDGLDGREGSKDPRWRGAHPIAHARRRPCMH